MLEAIALAAGIGIDVQDGALEPRPRQIVHEDRDACRLESPSFVGRVVLDGDPEPGPSAADEVAHAENRPGEVRLRPEPPRGRFGDRERRSFGLDASRHPRIL